MTPQEYFNKFAGQYLRNKIILTSNDIKRALDFAKEAAPKLIEREIYKHENLDSLVKTLTNGGTTEIATGRFIGFDFFNSKIKKEGEEELCDLNDIGLQIGVKSVRMNNGLPLVYGSKNIKHPEIITVIGWRPEEVYIIGYATIPMIEYYRSREFIWGDAKKNSKKCGYWGFHKLHEFKTFEDLKDLYSNKEINSYNNFTDTISEYFNESNFISKTK